MRGGGGGGKVWEDNGDWYRYGGEGWLLLVVLVSRSVAVAGAGAVCLACAGAGAGAGVVCLVEIGVRVGRVVRKDSWGFGGGAAAAAAAAAESEDNDEPGEEEGEGAAAGCDTCYGWDWKLRGTGSWGGGWSRCGLRFGRNNEVGRCCDGYDRGGPGCECQSGGNGDCCFGLENAEGS